jgi:hypothetical protein
MNRSILLIAALAIGANSLADDDYQNCPCQRCGCQSQCQKVCRVVCEMKEVKEVCYSCKCEDFCVPGPSCKCGEVCECDPCHASGCKCFDCLLGRHHGKSCRTVWQPSCEATLHTRNKLYKREIKKQVPTYKWVVEYCCDQCQCASPAITEKSQQPTSPKPAQATAEEPASAPMPPPAELKMPHSAESSDKYAAKPVLPWKQLLK